TDKTSFMLQDVRSRCDRSLRKRAVGPEYLGTFIAVRWNAQQSQWSPLRHARSAIKGRVELTSPINDPREVQGKLSMSINHRSLPHLSVNCPSQYNACTVEQQRLCVHAGCPMDA
ncbi:hypothetical protein GLOTRDRAFT_100566, partial [Gloeophyllum trabeum ATCC 11539]